MWIGWDRSCGGAIRVGGGKVRDKTGRAYFAGL